jgi:hypothetical protein
MENIGVSVGEWTSNDFQNFTSRNKPLDCDSLVVSSRQNCSISFSEDNARKRANSQLKKDGLSVLQIKTYWNRFKRDVQKTFDYRLFLEYAYQEFTKEGGGNSNNQTSVLDRINARRGRNNTDTNTDINTDRNNTDQTDRRNNNPFTNPNKDSKNSTSSLETNGQKSDSNTKYYIYGGIGLVVVLGAFLIFKK